MTQTAIQAGTGYRSLANSSTVVGLEILPDQDSGLAVNPCIMAESTAAPAIRTRTRPRKRGYHGSFILRYEMAVQRVVNGKMAGFTLLCFGCSVEMMNRSLSCDLLVAEQAVPEVNENVGRGVTIPLLFMAAETCKGSPGCATR